ncbi:MAG: cupin domain-containing protein [Candidatus Dormibacteraceae bacterium]
MRNWNLKTVEAQPREAQILSTTDDSRAVVLNLPAGEQLQEHEVHERAWVVVVSGEVEVGVVDGESMQAGPGHLFEFPPRERHWIAAFSDTRLLLMLTPWPGDGHPGAMTLEEKAGVRARAAERVE